MTLITGASAGLGAEFARQCATRGDELVLVARRRERLDALAAELGGKVHVIASDLSKAEAAAELMAEVERLGLWIETLINNAGFGLTGRFADIPLGRQQQMIDLNIRTLTTLAHLALPKMIERGRGGILNVASTAAFQPGPGFAVYFATKAYVLSFSEALHQELRRKGIRVSALCPGPTRTEFGQVAGVTSQSFDRFSADAPAVVGAGLRGLQRNKAVIVPGLTNKVTAQSGRVIPRALMRRIVASLKL
ncbi:MAG TPA: SDR family oxidoreductase [Allosphingosinicella sp.]|uniref:SDR family NAD(P)-dependent oxidoreductase n=1 Tax=Allosphingosinicella sp. TaxID=2823234 RepID=UPI002ED81E77